MNTAVATARIIVTKGEGKAGGGGREGGGKLHYIKDKNCLLRICKFLGVTTASFRRILLYRMRCDSFYFAPNAIKTKFHFSSSD